MPKEEVPHRGARVYIYTRVSTAMQVDGYSLDAQKKEIEREVTYQEMKIINEYSDEGKSGKDIKGRPAFQQMMDDIVSEKDKISFVLVFKLSRFGRNTADILNSVKIMKKHGAHLICVEDKIDSSLDSGKLMIAILGAMAEIERDNILAQTMAGRKEKARQGLSNGGLAPYGYKSVGGKLEIEDDEAEIIRMIFERYIKTSYGPDGVANWLNSMGYKKKKKRPQEVTYFQRKFVDDVLKNPAYVGTIAYGRTTSAPKEDDPDSYHRIAADDYIETENAHEAIITQDTWDAAQAKIESMKGKKQKREASHEYLLSCLLKCPSCGKAMTGIPSKCSVEKDDGTLYPAYYSYACRPTTADRQKGSTCHFGQVACRKIDEPVRDIILALINSDTFGDRLVDLADEKLSISEVQKLIEATKEKRRQANGKQRKLESQQLQLDIDDKHYDRKFDSLTRQLDSLYAEMDELEDTLEDAEARLDSIKKQGLSRDSIYEALKFFEKVYDKASDFDKKTLLHSFIETIELYPEKSRKYGCPIKSITFQFPVSYKGESIYGLRFPKPEKGKFSPPNLTTAETVVTLCREKVGGY